MQIEDGFYIYNDCVVRGISNNNLISENLPETVHSARQSRIQSTVSSPVSARAATRTSVRSAVVKTSTVSMANAGVAKLNERSSQKQQFQQSGAQSARAATKLSAINMGTKVAVVKENTLIPKECSASYNGCMDTLCMIPNTSGGRCRCDDSVFDLDNMIIKLQQFDKKTELVKQHGLDRLKIGKSIDEVYSIADETEEKVVKDQQKNTVDFLEQLSEATDKKTEAMGSGLVTQQGKDLYVYANGLCVEQLPDNCMDYVFMLQTLYTKQIDEDCTGYENSLKKQSLSSEQLQQQSQSEIRAAALERYNEDNKW